MVLSIRLFRQVEIVRPEEITSLREKWVRKIRGSVWNGLKVRSLKHNDLRRLEELCTS